MRVAVVGAGGIGGLYGGVLARAGHEVSFLARGAHLDAIRSNGLRVQSADFGTFTVHGRASNDPSDLGKADLVLFAVKTYDLDEAARAAALLLADDGSLITFQNGIDAADRVAAYTGEAAVLIGTTRLETTVLEWGVIGHLSPGHLVTVSEFNGPPTPRVEGVAATLKDAGINAVVAPDGRRALWEKAAMLVPMATCTAVCRASFGPIRELPETHELILNLFAEVRAVAKASGIELGHAQGAPAGLTLDSAPPTMTTSMARDFERGRRTELDALTGAVVRLAEVKGVPVPTLRTCYAILKLRETLEAPRSQEVGTLAARG